MGKKNKLLIYGGNYNTKDGTPVRDYIHISDLAEMHLITGKYLINGNKSNIFNCGYGKGFSVKEIVENYNKLLKNKINYKIVSRRKGDGESVIANIKKFNKFFSWEPKFNKIDYILKTSYEWEKKLKKFK